MHFNEPGKASVDWIFEISIQPGLNIPVHIDLQHDELTLCISESHTHWFPCTDQAEIDNFVHCVVGFLQGSIRLKETLRGQRVVRGELQERIGADWKSFSVMGVLFPSLAKKTTRIIKNECV